MTEPTEAEAHLADLDSDIEAAFEALEEFADRMGDVRRRMDLHKPAGEYSPPIELIRRALQLTKIQEVTAAVLDGSFHVVSSPRDFIDIIMSQVDSFAPEDDSPEDKPN